MILLIIAATLISFYFNLKLVRNGSLFTFYSPLTRVWELLSGGILAWFVCYYKTVPLSIIKHKLDQFLRKTIYHKIKNTQNSILLNFLSVIGIILITYGIFRITIRFHFPGKWALLPVLGTVLVIAAGPTAYLNRKILSNRFLVWIGVISYPLYLWHWPILSFLRILEGDLLHRNLRILAIIASIFMAFITYNFFEKPIRLQIFKSSKILFLICPMIIISCMGFYTFAKAGLISRNIAKQSNDFNYDYSNINGYQRCDQKDFAIKNQLLNMCFYDKTKKPTAAIIGDSHAEDKFRGLIRNDRQNSWISLANSSCQPVTGVNIEGDEKHCKEKFEKILFYIKDNKEIKNIVLSFFGNPFKQDLYAADHVKNNMGPKDIKFYSDTYKYKSRKELFYIGLDNTIKFLTQNHKKVFLFIDVPELPFFPKDCFRNPLKNCTLTRNEALNRQMELRIIIETLKQNNPSITIFDPINLLCDEKFCHYRNENIIIYRDSHHVSERGSDLIAKSFISSINFITDEAVQY